MLRHDNKMYGSKQNSNLALWLAETLPLSRFLGFWVARIDSDMLVVHTSCATMFVCERVCVYGCLSVCPSARLLVCLSVWRSVCLSLPQALHTERRNRGTPRKKARMPGRTLERQRA